MTHQGKPCGGTLFETSSELELFSAHSPHALCFRYVPHKLFNLADSEVDALNREILHHLGDSSVMLPLGVVSNGRLTLTVVVTESEPQLADLELLAGEVVYYGRRIMSRRTGAILG